MLLIPSMLLPKRIISSLGLTLKLISPLGNSTPISGLINYWRKRLFPSSFSSFLPFLLYPSPLPLFSFPIYLFILCWLITTLLLSHFPLVSLLHDFSIFLSFSPFLYPFLLLLSVGRRGFIPILLNQTCMQLVACYSKEHTTRTSLPSFSASPLPFISFIIPSSPPSFSLSMPSQYLNSLLLQSSLSPPQACHHSILSLLLLSQ